MHRPDMNRPRNLSHTTAHLIFSTSAKTTTSLFVSLLLRVFSGLVYSKPLTHQKTMFVPKMSIPAANSLCRGGFLGFVGLVYFFPGVPWWLGVMVFGVASCYLQLPGLGYTLPKKIKIKTIGPGGRPSGGWGAGGLPETPVRAGWARGA